MKSQQWLLITVAALIIFAGCAERQDFIVSTEEHAFQLLNQIRTTGWAVDISIAGDSAYVAEHEGGVTIWDISNPANPVIKDTLKTSGSSKKIKFAPQSNLFLVNEANSQGGVAFITYIDHHNVHEPMRRFGNVGSGTMNDFSFHELSPDTVILAGIDATDGLFLQTLYWSTDISEWEKGSSNFEDNLSLDFGRMRGLYYDYDHIYIANNEMGFTIISVEYTVPGEGIVMTVQGSVDTPGASRSVGLNHAKTHAIVADWQTGLVVIDISDVTNPQIVSTFQPGGVDQAIKVAVKDNIAYLLDRYNGMFAIDVSDPLEPILVGRYDTPTPTGIAITEDDIVYLTDEDLGIIILEWR